MIPVDEGKIVKSKVAEAANFVQVGDNSAALKSLQEALEVGPSQDKHLALITPEWQRARSALVIPPGHAPIEIYADGMEVGVARTAAVQTAREARLRYLFFIDYDNIIPADALIKLSYFLDNNPDYDIASGMYCMKSLPPFPLLWRDWNDGVDFDWCFGDTIKENIVGIPMGCCLLRLSLFDNMLNTQDNPWFQTVDKPVNVGGKWGRMMMTEDLWFTKRYTDEVDKQHKKIMVDTSIWLPHICHITGKQYLLGEDTLPMKRLRAKQAGKVLECDLEAKAKPAQFSGMILHVGCGTAPLPDKFAGCQEIRLDIDEKVNPDIVGTITDIPLINGSVDAIYSSHNLEHIDEHEVPVALSEFYRVLKPGGRVIIECPDAQSVAEAIPKIGIEGTLYDSPAGPIRPKDVLFGLQSAVAAGNSYYAHRTAFTRESLESILTKANFKKVEVTRQAGAYALIAQATRP